MKYAMVVALLGVVGCNAGSDVPNVGNAEAAFEGKEATCNPPVETKWWDGGPLNVYGPNTTVLFAEFEDMPGIVVAYGVDHVKGTVAFRYFMKPSQKPKFGSQASFEDIGVLAGVPRQPPIGPGPPPGTWDKIDSSMINTAFALHTVLEAPPDYSCRAPF